MGKDQELLEAARNGNAPVVEKILNQRAKRSGPLASLRRGPGANVQDASGYSALHHASLNGHQDIVELLLTHEASTNILDNKGSSPLHLAAWAGNIDIVRLLLCHGPSVPNVNLTTRDNETALHCAAQYGHTEVVTLLLEHSCDPTIRNSREETALDLAAQYGRLETVELLVRTHPELIQPYSRSYKSGCVFPHTPLHLASRNGHKAVVEVLLAAGMDVNVKTASGTALHEAALCGKLDVVRTLLHAGVDLQLRDAKHNTVLDLLRQFPKHVSQELFTTIKRHPTMQKSEDSDSERRFPPLPSIDPNLGSPYENVRSISEYSRHKRYSSRSTGSGVESSPGSSPVQHWDYYAQKANETQNADFSKSVMDSSFHSEDSCQKDADQVSLSSAASSTSGPSFRDKKLIAPDYSGTYVPMGAGSMPSPGSTGSKVSPTPPKKPPRRNLSVSPTHISPNVPLPSPSAYEYIYLARSADEHTPNRKPEILRRGKSADQYEVMKLRQNYVTSIDIADIKNSPVLQRRKSEDSDKFLKEKREPVALTMYYDNIQVRTTNPRRKLRRNPNDRDKVYENYEPPFLNNNANALSNSNDENNRTFTSNAYITLKSSQESLLDGNGKKVKTPIEGKNGVKKIICPLSPTNYQQPPTPDHPPPTALQAEMSIHERIRPLSQKRKKSRQQTATKQTDLDSFTNLRPYSTKMPDPNAFDYKRRSRDIETETDEELFLYPFSLDSSGSFSSSVSLSDKSVSTDNNVEEFVGDVPFAVIGPPCNATKGCLTDNNFKSALVSIRSESKREENLKLRNVDEKIMTKDEGYYSFEHNRHPYKDKSEGSVETTFGEGLYKGSTNQLMEASHKIVPAERPKTLRKLKNVYENLGKEDGNVTSEENDKFQTSSTDRSLSILSPFDEQEEWAKISEIMASFCSGLVRDSIFVAEMEREIQARLGLSSQKKVDESPKITSQIGQWLQTMNLSQYESVFLDNGYDDLDFLNGLLDDEELKYLGLSDDEITKVIKELNSLPNKISEVQKEFPQNNHKNNKINNITSNNSVYDQDNEDVNIGEECEDKSESEKRDFQFVENWLEIINLGIYKETFRRHLYLDLERIKRVWEVELTAVLEITKRGHRRRILASVNSLFKGEVASGSNLEELTADLSLLKSNIQQLKEEIREKLPTPINSPATAPSSKSFLTPAAPASGTLRHSHKKNKPAPPPPTDIGTPVKPAPPDLPIRNPSELLVGVPSTLTTQWRHRPEELVTGYITYVAKYLGSTVVKELKGTESTKKSIQKLKKTSTELTTTPDIMLAISYRGVKFLNTGTKDLVCEHEIRNIHCACQDADDLTHFAYITKDHISRSHYCHVFCVETMDQATEVILTLGQAFEVAYQMTLREQFSGNRRGNGHTRSQSANQIVANSLPINNGNNQQQSNHSRSYSVNEMKVIDSLKHQEEEKSGDDERAPLASAATEDL